MKIPLVRRLRYNEAMISKLSGILAYADPGSVILDVGGVGYKLFTTIGIIDGQIGRPMTLWTYLAVRENAMNLYGFMTKDELDIFEELIGVSGIGQKRRLAY